MKGLTIWQTMVIAELMHRISVNVAVKEIYEFKY